MLPEPADTKRVTLSLMLAVVSVSLCALVAVLLLAAYVTHCRTSGQSVDPRLSRSTLVKWLFVRHAYRELLMAIGQSRGERFPTTWDLDTRAMLGREQFEPMEMYGEARYRRRPTIRILDFSVWTGLERANVITVETPALVAALDRCQTLRRVSFETDAMGFKKTAFLWSPGTPSVLFLGDSFVEGLHVASEDTFVNLFGRRMREEGFEGVPVNAGVDGYGTLEEAWTAENYGASLGARVVVENLYLNDVNSDPRLVMQRSRIPPGSYHEMFKYLNRLEAYCKREAMTLVVAVIPDKEQLGRGPEAQRFQERVARWCAARSVSFLDPLPYLRQRGKEANYFSWDPHLSEVGHRNYANFLFGQMAPLLETRLARQATVGR